MDWDDDFLYHNDTVHGTITAYKIDTAGVPIRDDPSKPIQGKVVVNTDKKDGTPLAGPAALRRLMSLTCGHDHAHL